MLGYIILGSLVGFATNVAALLLGASVWFAMMLHSIAGIAAMVLLIAVQVAMDIVTRRAEPKTNDDLGNDPSDDHASELMINVPPVIAEKPSRQISILAHQIARMPNADLSEGRRALHPSKAASDVASVEIGESKRSMKILAVDDDPFILGLIPAIAAKAGFCEAVSLASGQLALEELEKAGSIFDCLLLDISMPEMNGVELCQRARQISGYKHTPIIMLTGMRDRKSMNDAFQAGATDYVTKPFEISELSERLSWVREMNENPVNWFSEVGPSSIRPVDAASREDLPLSDDFQLDGVANFISRGAMTNYLTQLSVADAINTSIVAVKVEWSDTVYSRTSYLPFISILEGIADAINDIVGADQCMVAYAGDATLLIIANTPELPASIDLEAEINRALESTPAGWSVDEKLAVNVSVGRSIRPAGDKSKRAAISFGRAIGSASNRTLEKQNRARPPRIRLLG